MNNKDLEKLGKLLCFIGEGKPISTAITHQNLMRLVNGDLSHIGDAILRGEEIACSTTFASIGRTIKFSSELRFNGGSDKYTILAKRVTVLGIEVDPFTEDDAVTLNEDVAYYQGFHVELDILTGAFVVSCTSCKTLIYRACVNKTFFKKKEDAQKIADKLNDLLSGGTIPNSSANERLEVAYTPQSDRWWPDAKIIASEGDFVVFTRSGKLKPLIRHKSDVSFRPAQSYRGEE